MGQGDRGTVGGQDRVVVEIGPSDTGGDWTKTRKGGDEYRGWYRGVKEHIFVFRKVVGLWQSRSGEIERPGWGTVRGTE